MTRPLDVPTLDFLARALSESVHALPFTGLPALRHSQLGQACEPF